MTGLPTSTTLDPAFVNFIEQYSGSESYRLRDGYALINYDNKRSAEQACSKISGRHFCGSPVQAMIKGAPQFSVKINHLPQSVKEEELHDICSNIGIVTSVKVNNGYAYVNFSDLESAQNATRYLNKGKFNGRTVTAKIHGQQQSLPTITMSMHEPPARKPANHGLMLAYGGTPIPNLSTPSYISQLPLYKTPRVPEQQATSATVKVELDRPGLSGNDLFHYFSQFGTVQGEPLIHSGDPDYAYVNFHNPNDATKAYQQKQVRLKTVTLTIKPSNKARKIVPKKDTQSFASGDYVVDQLIATQYFTEIKKKLVLFYVSITSSSEGIQVTGNQEDVEKAMVLLKTEASLLRTEIIKLSYEFDCDVIPNFSDAELFQVLQSKHCTEFSVLRNDQSEEKVVLFCDAVMAFLQNPAPMKRLLFDDYYFNDEKGEIPVWSFLDDNGKYAEMSDEDSKMIEHLHQTAIRSSYRVRSSHRAHCQHTIGKFQYLYDFLLMKQTNLSTSKVRSIKRSKKCDYQQVSQTVTIICRGHKENVKASFAELIETIKKASSTKVVTVSEALQDKISEVASQYCVAIQMHSRGLTLTGNEECVNRVSIELKAKIMEATSSNAALLAESLGPFWESQAEDPELKSVTRHSKEWKYIQKKVNETLPNSSVSEIQRIQSKWLWSKYAFCRQRMKIKNGNSNVNEALLFHGPRQTTPETIYTSEYGFDFRFGSSGMWGKGAYFACNASYSNIYAYNLPHSYGTKQMFLAFVLTGISVEHPGSSSLDKPPLKPSSSTQERYDSVKGNSGSSEIFVVYDHDKSYPAYLVTYT